MSKPIALVLALLLALPLALAAAVETEEWRDLTDDQLARELNRVQRELDEFRELQTTLARSERASNNTDRARVIDRLQQHMIDLVVRRENALGVEHTIIRHGQPVGELTDAAKVGTPNANKETRRRMRKGTSQKPDAFLRLAWMQQQVMGGERIYRPAVERQPGAFEQYSNLVQSFGSSLHEEFSGLLAEQERRAGMVDADAAPDSLESQP